MGEKVTAPCHLRAQDTEERQKGEAECSSKFMAFELGSKHQSSFAKQLCGKLSWWKEESVCLKEQDEHRP